MKRKVLIWVLLAVFAAIAAVSGFHIYQILSSYQAGDAAYEDLTQYVTVPVPVPQETTETQETIQPSPTSQEAAETPADDIVWPEVDFAALAEINPDIVGWIYIEGTQINYPVVQCSDNETYLKRMFDGSSNSAGCIFLDCRNTGDFSNSHSVIYGHHMKNGSMFAGLVKYKEQSYYDEHPVALLLTPSGNYQVTLFSGYVASEEEDAWQVSYDSVEDFDQWLQSTKERSLFTSDVTPEVSDRVLTLSTCSYEFENARFVLVGVLN